MNQVEGAQMNARAKGRLVRAIAFALVAMLTSPVRAEDPASTTEPAADDADHAQSLSDINKKLSNPVSDIWSITFQQNNFRVSPGPGENDRWSTNLLLQPVLPVSVTDDWNLITRPVIPLFVSQPHPEVGRPSAIGRSTAFGDISLFQLISPSPKIAGHWLLGLGPTWTFPSAPSDFTGSGKWQVGPAGIVGYLSEKFIVGALVQNWWSFAGDDDRPEAASMILQPIASYFLKDGWSVGYSGNILANWKNDSSNTWTVPLGMSVAKVAKLGKVPVRFALGLQWMPIQPDRYGQDWNIQLIIAPVLPKLINGNLAEPSSLRFGLN
jgi:hypothetical protein